MQRNTVGRSPFFCRNTLSLALGLALGFPALAIVPQAAAQTTANVRKHTFNLSSQPLGTSVNQLAEIANVQIMVPPELVRGRTAPALAGSYSLDAALDTLLAGTGLTHHSTRSGVITIAKSAAPAVKPAAAPKASPPAAADGGSSETTNLATVQVTGSRIKRAHVEGP